MARSAVRDPVLELVAVLGKDADRGVAGGVAHAADRRAVVGGGDGDEPVDVLAAAGAGDDAIDDPVHPAHAVAARRALAARLVVVEADQHLEQAHHARPLGDDHHPAGAQARAGRDEAGVVERQRRDLGGGQHLGRDAAGDDALELLAAEHAAAVLVQELRERVAVLDLVDAGPLHVARDRDQLRSRALRRADAVEGRGAVADDAGDVGQGLDVVDDGRPLVQAAHRQARRTVARVALPALERCQQPGSLAADVRARAAVDDDVAGELVAGDPLAEPAGGIGFLDRAGDAPVRQVELAADVDEGVAYLQRPGGDQHRLEQQVRRVLEDPAVLEGAGLALVGVGAQVVRQVVVEVDHAPLAPRRKGGAAVAQDPGSGDLFRHLLRAHLAQHLLERGVAAAGAVVGEAVRGRGDREGHQQLPAGHRPSSASRASTRAGVMSSWYASLTITTGAVPHEPRHSTVDRVKRPSAVVSPGATPRRARKVLEQSLAAAHRAREVAARLQVPAADGRAPKLRVVRKDFLDLDARHAQVGGEPVDVLVGDEAAVLLDPAQAGQHQRRLEAGREAPAHRLELGEEMLHRSHSPPIMLIEPKVGTMSASWPPSSMQPTAPTWTKLGERTWTLYGVPPPVETR